MREYPSRSASLIHGIKVSEIEIGDLLVGPGDAEWAWREVLEIGISGGKTRLRLQNPEPPGDSWAIFGAKTVSVARGGYRGPPKPLTAEEIEDHQKWCHDYDVFTGKIKVRPQHIAGALPSLPRRRALVTEATAAPVPAAAPVAPAAAPSTPTPTPTPTTGARLPARLPARRK